MVQQDWASECPDVKNYKWRLNPVWHRMLYSCTHMATVGFKGLTVRLNVRSSTPVRGPVVVCEQTTATKTLSYTTCQAFSICSICGFDEMWKFLYTSFVWNSASESGNHRRSICFHRTFCRKLRDFDLLPEPHDPRPSPLQWPLASGTIYRAMCNGCCKFYHLCVHV